MEVFRSFDISYEFLVRGIGPIQKDIAVDRRINLLLAGFERKLDDRHEGEMIQLNIGAPLVGYIVFYEHIAEPFILQVLQGLVGKFDSGSVFGHAYWFEARGGILYKGW